MADKLILNPDRSTRVDGDNLKKLLLSPEDWIALEELILLLRPFVDATNLTSGSVYPTLSLWYPTLYCLRKYLKNITHNLTSPQIKVTCNEILASLHKRWDIPDELGCVASFLDPRFKSLNFLSIDQIETTKQNLKKQIEVSETSSSPFVTPILSNSTSIFLDFFNHDISSQPPISIVDTEISLYSQLPTLSILPLNHPQYHLHDPLQWWNERKDTFPLLSKQARKFLSIPATSVPSERLFSDAGNIITDKRNRLNPNTVHDLLFLKENDHLITLYSK